MRSQASSRATGGKTRPMSPQVRGGAAEQQDAADEAGASHGASLLILVLGRPDMIRSMTSVLLVVLALAGCDTMIADRIVVRTPTVPRANAPATQADVLAVVRDTLASAGFERMDGRGPEHWWWRNPDKGPGVHATVHPMADGADVRLSQDLYGPIGKSQKYRRVKVALTEATSRAFGKGAVRIE